MQMMLVLLITTQMKPRTSCHQIHAAPGRKRPWSSQFKRQNYLKTIKVSETTENEIADLKLAFKCLECKRPFPTKRGMNIHERWCDRTESNRSHKGSLADKAVQLSKRKSAEKERFQVSIEGDTIENVHSFV